MPTTAFTFASINASKKSNQSQRRNKDAHARRAEQHALSWIKVDQIRLALSFLFSLFACLVLSLSLQLVAWQKLIRALGASVCNAEKTTAA